MSDKNNATSATSASSAPAGTTKAPLFSIEADNPRELVLRAAQALLKLGEFEHRKTEPEKGEAAKYMLWNIDDSGKIAGYNAGITLTPEEARMFPTTEGLPIVFSSSFVLRQLTAPSAVTAKLAEKRAATATADANRVSRSSTNAILDELNRRLIAEGKEPIKL